MVQMWNCSIDTDLMDQARVRRLFVNDVAHAPDGWEGDPLMDRMGFVISFRVFNKNLWRRLDVV